MRRVVSLFVLGVLATAGIVAGVFAPGGGATPTAANATVKITVKASEFKFALSKRSVPAGSTVIFNVVNVGKISHDFKIAGKKTPTLNPGKKAVIKVLFKKKGRYPYLCTLLGHAGAGMKGSFSVGVAPAPATTAPATTTTTDQQGCETIEGDVTDRAARPIEGLRVTLEKDGAVLDEQGTGTDGHYRLTVP
jgi:uncharacterized cupredoxin-like copper-binding protein